LVRRLRDRGSRVRVFVRRPPEDIPPGVEVVVGNLGDLEAVDRAVRGAKLVIHAGAAMTGGWVEHECATIAGTRNIVHACRRHGAAKLVHVSSLSVVDWAGEHGGTISEATPLEPRAEERGSYTRAKLAAEHIVSQSCLEHGLPAVIVRPGQIFGGRIPLLTPAIARGIGQWRLILGNGNAPLPLVYMDDVVDGILSAADSALHRGEIIQLVDDVTPTQNEVLAAALTEAELARVLHVPQWLLLFAGRTSELVFAMLRRRSPVSAYRFRSALASRRFTNQQARRLLGWTAAVGVKAGMRRVLGRRTESNPDLHAEAQVAQVVTE
jgi:nucleoside-diphosphate-sugar epimerase